VDACGHRRKENSLEFSFGRRFSERLWMLADVYGRPRMAPRAGFEIGRKFLNTHLVQCCERAEYPIRTPSLQSLAFSKLGGRVVRPALHAGL